MREVLVDLQKQVNDSVDSVAHSNTLKSFLCVQLIEYEH